MKKVLLFLFNLLIISQLSFSQSVTLVPTNSANPTKGTMTYDNVNNVLQYWNGLAWIPITNAASGIGWTLNGNNIYSNNTGNIGIGTTNPQTLLHLNPNGTGSILIGTNKNSGGYTNLEMGITAQSGGDAYVQSISNSGSSYGSLLLNLFGGNVGIGTSNTTQKLTVAGNTAISGILDVGSNAAIVGNITVNAGKGIVRSNDGTQLKTILYTTPNNIAIPNFTVGSVGIVPMVFSAFSAPPRISVSDTEGIINADNLLITVTNVTNSSATIVVRNVGTQTVSAINGIIRAIIIGPQ